MEVRMKRLRAAFSFVAIYCLILAVAGSAWGQSTLNMTLKGNFGKGEGESKAVFAAGSLVFYGLGNKVQIASFSNPASPLKIGSVVVSEIVEDLVRTAINSNQYVVACGGPDMWIINVQSPTNPALTATVQVASGTTCEGIATSGTYAYVAAGGAGLRIYNIATPASPVFVASIDSLAYCESVVISGQYAYIAAGSRSHIVDISNPAVPVYVGQIAGYPGYHQGINVRSGYAYVCNYSVGVSVVNVSNPAAPVNVMEVPAGDRIARIVFDGNYMYVAIGDLGMKIFNVVNPASPVLVSTTPTAGRSRSLYYGAININNTPTGHIFVSNSTSANGVSAINVSNPASPTTSSFLAAATSPSGIAYTPFYSNGKVYVAYGTGGLRILDVSNPANPALLGTAPLGGESRGVVVSGNYAYVAARDSGVYVVDVTNAGLPVRLSRINTSRARGIAINGSNVYVATRDSGLVVLDITNPANPIWLTNVRGIDVENVATTGNVVGTSLFSSIRFYDITNPASPVAKGNTPSFRIGNEGFTIAGNYAYTPDGDSLKIFNITDLMTPTLVSKIKTGGYGYVAAVAGNYCYVASEGTGVRAINISNPSAPVEDGYYDGVPQSRGVAVNGNYVYVAEKTDGLSVYSNDLITSVENRGGMIPEVITLYQNFPNPFNPATQISFDLPSAAHVKLQVLNVLGQTIAVVLNEERSAGSHRIEFNAKNLSSGVYFYRLIAGEVVHVKRMTLTK